VRAAASLAGAERAAYLANLNTDELISFDPELAELQQLIVELLQIQYSENSAGKFSVDKVGAGQRSPNLADSLAMCFAPGSKAATIHTWAALADDRAPEVQRAAALSPEGRAAFAAECERFREAHPLAEQVEIAAPPEPTAPESSASLFARLGAADVAPAPAAPSAAGPGHDPRGELTPMARLAWLASRGPERPVIPPVTIVPERSTDGTAPHPEVAKVMRSFVHDVRNPTAVTAARQHAEALVRKRYRHEAENERRAGRVAAADALLAKLAEIGL
jgi:hypothetical protein